MAQFLLQNHFQIVKVIRSGLRLPWVELKWYFITYRRFKWGQPEMFWPKILIVKNSEFKNNPRKSLKKWIFSSTFPVQKKKKIQNNSQNSKNSRTTGHPETLCMELHASLGYFGNLPLLVTINPNLKFFNPLFGIVVGGRGAGHCKWWSQHK